MKKWGANHNNSHKNDADHHLYEFYDQQEKETFKYGISCEPIGEDGLSKRMRRQLEIFNLAAGWVRYIVHILLTGIPGRKTAEQIEDEHMEAFEEKHGRLPRGNKSKNRKSR